MEFSAPGGDAADEPRLEARVVKDSYHVPHRPVVLKRCEGGALRAVDSRGPSEEAIVHAVLAWLSVNPDKSVTAQSIRIRQGAGADAYAAITSEIPAAGPACIYCAIRSGLSTRILDHEQYKRDNRTTGKRLIPGPAFTGVYPSEDLQEELHTCDVP